MEDSPRSATRPFETRFAEWVVAYRWQIIAATAMLVLFATAGGLFLKFSTDYRILFSEDNPELQALESLENTYGKSDNVLFMIVPGRSRRHIGTGPCGRGLADRARVADAVTPRESIQSRTSSTRPRMATTLSVRDLVDPDETGRCGGTIAGIRAVGSGRSRGLQAT